MLKSAVYPWFPDDTPTTPSVHSLESMSEVPKALQTITETATRSAESSILITGKSAAK